jgi:hypothetical protein
MMKKIFLTMVCAGFCLPVISCSKTNQEADNTGPQSKQFSFKNDVANTSKNGTKAVRLLDVVSTTAELGLYGGEKKVSGTIYWFFHTKKNCLMLSSKPIPLMTKG